MVEFIIHSGFYAEWIEKINKSEMIAVKRYFFYVGLK